MCVFSYPVYSFSTSLYCPTSCFNFQFIETEAGIMGYVPWNLKMSFKSMFPWEERKIKVVLAHFQYQQHKTVCFCFSSDPGLLFFCRSKRRTKTFCLIWTSSFYVLQHQSLCLIHSVIHYITTPSVLHQLSPQWDKVNIHQRICQIGYRKRSM